MSSNLHGYSTAITLVAAILLLAGCDGGPSPLESHRETLERRAPGCNGSGGSEGCDSVTVQWEVFDGRPALNSAIREQLLRQLQGNGEAGSPADSLEALADDFLAEAAQTPADAASWQLTGEVKRLSRRGDLLTLAIDSYIYTGGAHGLPLTHWLNWDLAADEPVSLQQLLQPGREAAFWRLVEEAHRHWLQEQDADEDFRRIWPFQKTADFRPDDRGLVLLYGVYVLGPYTMGQVELTLPWDRLGGVVRDEYLPDS